MSLRKPDPTSAARSIGFNKPNVSNFFQILGELYDKYKFEPQRIYDCDETGISCVPKTKSKIISVRGKRQVGALTSADRGKTVTVEICFNAAGNFMPPMFIFPRIRFNKNLMNECPAGSWAECNPSGWMQAETFTNWFKRFLIFSQASKEYPVLLLLDGHTSHTRNLKVIDLARDNGVIILCLPPHCTHRLQPVDVSFMKPLSTYYDCEVTKYQKILTPILNIRLI